MRAPGRRERLSIPCPAGPIHVTDWRIGRYFFGGYFASSFFASSGSFFTSFDPVPSSSR